MNRLTEKIDGVVMSKERYGKHSPCHYCRWQSTGECKQDNCTYGSVLDRLAAYEDTGLAPDEIRILQEEHDFYSKEDVPASQRLVELALADKEGRCVVLPSKEKAINE